MIKTRAPRPVILAALTLVTIVFWIIFGIIRIISKPEDIEVPNEIIAPLNPTLDTATLDTVENRIHLDESQIGETVIAPTAETQDLNAILTPTELSILENLAQETATQSATTTQESTSSSTTVQEVVQ